VIKLSRLFSNFTVKRIKYFHPTGRESMPSGHPIHLGGFFKECATNKESFQTGNNQTMISKDFTLSEALHPTQHGFSDYKGGIIVFSTDVNSLDVSDSKLKIWISKTVKTFKNRWFRKSKIYKIVKKHNDSNDEYIGAISVGNFFKGRYAGDNGKMFNEKSQSLELGGISTEGLFMIAELIADEFNQETVLVKNLNVDKVYLVNSKNNT